jgi:hypothetical protein
MTHLKGQTSSLSGKVIDSDFNQLPIVNIYNRDTVLLATTDRNGDFLINITQNPKTLIIATVGMEWKFLDIADNCNNLEIILLPRYTYDFMSLRKVDRLRKKQFNKLAALHKSAYEKGVFKSEKPCYIDKFISISK